MSAEKTAAVRLSHSCSPAGASSSKKGRGKGRYGEEKKRWMRWGRGGGGERRGFRVEEDKSAETWRRRLKSGRR